jgi:hypothetical protein
VSDPGPAETLQILREIAKAERELDAEVRRATVKRRSNGDGTSESLDAYYELRLTPELREALLKFLTGKVTTWAEKNEIKNRLLAARRFELPDAAIDWAKAEDRARERGESVADLIYDEAKAKDPR